MLTKRNGNDMAGIPQHALTNYTRRLESAGFTLNINENPTFNKNVEIPDDLEKYYVNPENESVLQIYYNPDSSAGGQLVYNYFSYDDIFNAFEAYDPIQYIEGVSRQELIDKGTDEFDNAVERFLHDKTDFTNRNEDYLDRLNSLTEPRFAIYQLKSGEELHYHRFTSLETLNKEGLYVDRENYDRVYRGRLKEGETLDDIFRRFNIARPDDFHGHSLSVSDIIAIKENGNIKAHYVDDIGFSEIPDFTLSLEERVARRTLTDNLEKVADCQLASDEMDDLGDKLFDYENAPKYSGSGNSWLFGNGMTADRFEEITKRYNNGEDVRAELAKGVFRTSNNGNSISGNVYFINEGKNLTDFDYTCTSDENGITFRTKGGFEVTHSWERLGEAVIAAARREYDRHLELDRQYREDIDNPYAYYGDTDIDDARKAADAHNLQEFMEAYSGELSKAAVSLSDNDFSDYFEKRAAEALSEYDARSAVDKTWHKPLLDKSYLHDISKLVSAGVYNELKNETINRPALTQNDIDMLRQIEPRKSVLNFTSEELSAASAWARHFNEDIKNKSPFFRAENGEWRDKDETTVPIIAVEDKNVDFKIVRDDIKSRIIPRNSVVNADTGWTIQISRRGLEDTVAYAKFHNDIVAFNVIYSIQDIVQNGVLLDSVVFMVK